MGAGTLLCLNLPETIPSTLISLLSMEKLSSAKPATGAKKFGDHCSSQQDLWTSKPSGVGLSCNLPNHIWERRKTRQISAEIPILLGCGRSRNWQHADWTGWRPLAPSDWVRDSKIPSRKFVCLGRSLLNLVLWLMVKTLTFQEGRAIFCWKRGASLRRI